MSQSFDSYYPCIYADAEECMSEPEDFVETTEYAAADRLQRAMNAVDEAQQETEEAWADEVDPDEQDEGMPSALRWLHENSNEGMAEINRTRGQNFKEYEGPEVEHDEGYSLNIANRRVIGYIRGDRIVPAQTEGFIDSEDEEIDPIIEAEIEEERAAEERRNYGMNPTTRWLVNVQDMMVRVNNLLNRQ